MKKTVLYHFVTKTHAVPVELAENADYKKFINNDVVIVMKNYKTIWER